MGMIVSPQGPHSGCTPISSQLRSTWQPWQIAGIVGQHYPWRDRNHVAIDQVRRSV